MIDYGELLTWHKTRDWKSGVVVHAWDEGHRVDWEGMKILESDEAAACGFTVDLHLVISY